MSNVLMENFIGYSNAYSLDIDQHWSPMKQSPGPGVKLSNITFKVSQLLRAGKNVADNIFRIGKGRARTAQIVALSRLTATMPSLAPTSILGISRYGQTPATLSFTVARTRMVQAHA